MRPNCVKTGKVTTVSSGPIGRWRQWVQLVSAAQASEGEDSRQPGHHLPGDRFRVKLIRI